MDKVRRYRALGSLCRQQAAYNPDQSWYLLSQAEKWEHLAEEELAAHFRACGPTTVSANAVAAERSSDRRWKANAAA